MCLACVADLEVPVRAHCLVPFDPSTGAPPLLSLAAPFQTARARIQNLLSTSACRASRHRPRWSLPSLPAASPPRLLLKLPPSPQLARTASPPKRPSSRPPSPQLARTASPPRPPSSRPPSRPPSRTNKSGARKGCGEARCVFARVCLGGERQGDDSGRSGGRGEYIRSLLLPCIAQARRVGWVTAHGPRLQAIYHPTYGDLLAYTRRV